MTKYRDFFDDPELSSIVGNGLDRVGREITEEELTRSINFFSYYKHSIDSFPIGARREAIQQFVNDGFVVPDWVVRASDKFLLDNSK